MQLYRTFSVEIQRGRLNIMNIMTTTPARYDIAPQVIGSGKNGYYVVITTLNDSLIHG